MAREQAEQPRLVNYVGDMEGTAVQWK